MKRPALRAAVRVVVASGVGAFTLAAVGGRSDRTVPVAAYVVIVVGLAGAEVLRAVARRSPPDLDPVAPLVTRPRPVSARRPVGLLGWEALMESAVTSGRAARIRLEPRLRELAARRLSVTAGVDVGVEPEKAASALGPAAAALVHPPGAVPEPDDPGVDLTALERTVEALERLSVT